MRATPVVLNGLYYNGVKGCSGEILKCSNSGIFENFYYY